MSDDATPAKARLTDSLGPLLEPDGEFYLWHTQYRVQSKAAYSAETVRRLLAAERERCAQLCDREAARWRGKQDISDFKLCAAAIRKEV